MVDQVKEKEDERLALVEEMRKQDTRRLDTQRNDKRAEFGSFMRSRETAQQHDQNREKQSSNQRAAAQSRLNAKNGIVTNRGRAAILQDSNKRGGKSTKDTSAQQANDTQHREETQRSEEQRLKRENLLGQRGTPVSRNDANQSKGKGGGGGTQSHSQQNTAAQVAATPTFQMQGTQSAQKSSGGATVSTQQMIDSIVKAVRTGVSQKLSVVQIDLKDDVLGGSTVSISRDKDGAVSVEVNTLDAQVKSLMNAGDSMKSLHKAFADKGLVLKGFEVHVAGRG